MIKVFFRGNKKLPMFKALVAIDVSGSIGTEDVRSFLNEIQWLFHKNEAQVELMTFDDGITAKAVIKDVDDLQEFKQIHGRGGTSFKAVFDYAKEENVKEVIIFTDGYGDQDALERPDKDMKVWWICTQKEPTFPFGEKFLLDE